MTRRAAVATALLVATLAAGCASAPPATPGATPGAPGASSMGSHPADPWEAFNRKMQAFNDAVDDAVLRPVATAYRDALPALVRKGIDNVFGNIGDVWSAANHLLQGKVHSGLDMGMRVLTNTLLGLGGLLDPATEMKLERRSEDFGQTLGRWGVGPGPYVVLPLFGPRTVRDSFGLLVDRQADGSKLVDPEAARYAYSALDLINTRANLLSASALLNQVALDRYSFLRDAYLSRRLDQVHDGAPPLENFDDGDPEAPPKEGKK